MIYGEKCAFRSESVVTDRHQIHSHPNQPSPLRPYNRLKCCYIVSIPRGLLHINWTGERN